MPLWWLASLKKLKQPVSLFDRLSLHSASVRHVKVSVSDVKKGDWLFHDGRAVTVTSASSNCSGRGTRTFLITLKQVNGGSIVNIKPSGNESFEKIEIQDASYNYLYHDDTTMFLSDPRTFEQLEISLSLIDPTVLKGLEAGANMRVRMKADDLQPIQVLLDSARHGRLNAEAH